MGVAFILSVLFLPESQMRHFGEMTHSSTTTKKLLSNHMIQGLCSYQLVFSMCRAMFITFLSIFASNVVALNPGQIGILLGANIMPMFLYQLFTGRLADRRNKRWLIVAGGCVDLLFLALIPLMGSFWPLFILLGIGAIGGAVIIPAISAITVEQGKKYGIGKMLGILIAGQGIGMAAGPIIGGIAADSLSVSSVFLFAAGFGVVGLILFVFLINSKQNNNYVKQ